MALKDLIGFIDDTLANVFHAKAPDPAKLRAPVLKAIARTRTQFLQTEPVKGARWFQVNNNVVAFTPRLRGGAPLPINGQTTVFIPSERFPEFLDRLTAAVEAGEFDDEIARPRCSRCGATGDGRAPRSRCRPFASRATRRH